MSSCCSACETGGNCCGNFKTSNSCASIPPAPPYNSTKNPYYATYQSLPTNPYTGAVNPDYGFSLSQPNNNAFTLNPQSPLATGSNASQVVQLNEAKTIFNNVNIANAAGQGTLQPQVANIKFKSFREQALYLQAMSSLRVGLTPQTYLG
jgi:hypothetical protein